MNRRGFLGGASILGAACFAGCTSVLNVRQRAKRAAFSAPPLVENRPNGVYYPTHVEKMEMAGMQTKKGYGCALTYTYPHRFWLVTGTHTNEVQIKSNDSMHVMPVVWHQKTGQVLPGVNPKIDVAQNGDSVLSDSPWPMLSQPMGWHFGDNVQLPGKGTYEVTIHIGTPSITQTGMFSGMPKRLSFEFSLDYSRAELETISWHKLPKEKGKRGAVSHMKMAKLPSSTVPRASELPGNVLGRATSGDAEFVATVLDDATRFGGDESQLYLAVSPRSPYNRYLLPMMGLSTTIGRMKHDLKETLDHTLGLHYGIPIDTAPEKIQILVDTPPQFARHEGYETAFLDMPDMTIPS